MHINQFIKSLFVIFCVLWMLTLIISVPCPRELVDVAARVRVYVTSEVDQNTYIHEDLVLLHNDIAHWEVLVRDYCMKYGIAEEYFSTISDHVRDMLMKRGYFYNYRGSSFPAENLNSSSFIRSVLGKALEIRETNQSRNVQHTISPLIDTRNQAIDRLLTSIQGSISIDDLFIDLSLENENSSKFKSIMPKSYQNIATLGFNSGTESGYTVIVYQNKNSYTGGTTALKILADTISSLGYSVLVCNDTNNHINDCRNPNLASVVITGEWCRGALEDYGIKLFKGRGVQYHLGFHHMSDVCRGHVTVTHSQYLMESLSHRVLGAYFLGCPMTDAIQTIHSNIARYAYHNMFYDTSCNSTYVPIEKEDLIVIDPDLFDDYPPESRLEIELPSTYNVVYAKGLPHEELITLLQRAKVVVDLAMPGAERLAGEGLLMGAIPIISSRWNGASIIDFPGVFKVDPLNATEISDVINNAMLSYSEIVLQTKPKEFYAYIASLSRRLRDTVDVYIGSSRFHFVLFANTLDEEYLVNLQVLGLLYLHPLASIDIYVNDVGWYIRHHYQFFSMLKDSGYIGHDRFDPSDVQDERISLVRIMSITNLDINAASSNSSLLDIFPTHIWNPITIFLQDYVVPVEPYYIFSVLRKFVTDRSSLSTLRDNITFENISISCDFGYMADMVALNTTLSRSRVRNFLSSIRRHRDLNQECDMNSSTMIHVKALLDSNKSFDDQNNFVKYVRNTVAWFTTTLRMKNGRRSV